jgi:hypothetical protein
MIPLSNPNQSKIVVAELADALHAWQLSKVEYGVMIDAEFYQRERLETCRLSQRGRPFTGSDTPTLADGASADLHRAKLD